MIQSGVLVVDWPLTPGCDAGGVVVKAGARAISPLGKPFQEGDKVIGCTRLGIHKYSTYSEYFLMDAHVTLPLPKNINLIEGCTLGVATYVSCLICLDSRAWIFTRKTDCCTWYFQGAESSHP